MRKAIFTESKSGHKVLSNMLANGYAGKIFSGKNLLDNRPHPVFYCDIFLGKSKGRR
jgi:hypothetical protein